ncbi:MAG: queuosine precursor transporter [Bacteroidota bacterium]
MLDNKPAILFIFLGAFFVCNAIVANFIGVKIFAVEPTIGINPMNWNLFGHVGSLSLSAGVLLWPIVFIMTDIINEYYGKKGVKILSYIGVGMITYAFLMIYGAIELTPASFWTGSYAEQGVPDMQSAFATIFGQGAWIIVASNIAFLVGQVIDATVFHRLRKWTKNDKVWLRATGSTLISQFIDSFLVLYIAFVLGPPQWEISLFLAVGVVNYTYKFIVAVVLTPAIYLAHNLIDNYLGKERAEAMKRRAILD